MGCSVVRLSTGEEPATPFGNERGAKRRWAQRLMRKQDRQLVAKDMGRFGIQSANRVSPILGVASVAPLNQIALRLGFASRFGVSLCAPTNLLFNKFNTSNPNYS